MSNAIFHRDLLKNYQVLDRPGTFVVSVAYDVTDASLFTQDDYPRYLIPLRVITGENLIKILRVLDEHAEVPFNIVKKFFMTGAIFDNGEIDNSLLPIKGEKVVATFEEKDGTLYCTHLKMIDREELFYVNLSKVISFYSSVEKFLDE